MAVQTFPRFKVNPGPMPRLADTRGESFSASCALYIVFYWQKTA
jgi:hypothetical protein